MSDEVKGGAGGKFQAPPPVDMGDISGVPNPQGQGYSPPTPSYDASDPYGVGARYDHGGVGNGPGPGGTYPLTDFDKLGVSISVFGGIVMGVLHALIVPGARQTYAPLEDSLPVISKLVYSPGYGVASALLMVFLGWYGTRQRKLSDASSASTILFLGIAVAVVANGLLVYGLYAPATGAMDLLNR